MCLAPSLIHENGSMRDYRAWMSRGWCRVELISNALAPTAKQLILMQSRSDVQTYGARGISGNEWLMNPVGVADFTVEADRVAVTLNTPQSLINPLPGSATA